MEPLAISSNVLQAPGCRLDHILLTLANLLRIYSEPHVHTDIRDAILTSLELRWKRADQEVFILAVLFNPFVRDSGFSDASLPRAALVQMCMRAFQRFFRQEPTMELWDACHRYIKREGKFSDGNFAQDFHRTYAENKVCPHAAPAACYLMCYTEDGYRPRPHVARRPVDSGCYARSCRRPTTYTPRDTHSERKR